MPVGQVGKVGGCGFFYFFGWQSMLQVPPEAICQDDGLPMDDGAVCNGAADGDAAISRLNFLLRMLWFGWFLCRFPCHVRPQCKFSIHEFKIGMSYQSERLLCLYEKSRLFAGGSLTFLLGSLFLGFSENDNDNMLVEELGFGCTVWGDHLPKGIRACHWDRIAENFLHGGYF